MQNYFWNGFTGNLLREIVRRMLASLEAELIVSKVGPLPTSMQYWYMFNLFWTQLISFFYFILVPLVSLKCLFSPFFVLFCKWPASVIHFCVNVPSHIYFCNLERLLSDSVFCLINKIITASLIRCLMAWSEACLTVSGITSLAELLLHNQ